MFTQIIDAARTFKNYLLILIAPPMCAYCKEFLQERTVLCVPCKKKIIPLVSVVIPVTKKYHMPVFTVGEYADPLKKLVLSKGWSDYIASCELGHLMYERTPIGQMAFDIIIPIPLHWTRYAWRGYNQAYEIAAVLSERLNIPCHDVLRRVRATPLQSSVAHTERKGNVKHVFQVRKKYKALLKDKRILLVDDLMTTGATLQSASKVVVRSHPESIYAVVASRVK